MAQVMHTRPSALRTYAAAALFAVVYIGAMVLVLAPREMITVESGTVIRDAD
jgi:hypothetical protein